MAHAQAGRMQVACISVRGEKKPQLSSSIVEEVDSKDDVKAVIKAEPLVIPEIRKRKRLGRSQLIEMKAALRVEESQGSSIQSNHNLRKINRVERWSAER